MKKLACILVLLLACAGAGGYWFLGRSHPAEAASPAAEPTAARFVEVPPLMVSLIREEGASGVLIMKMSLELTPGADELEVQRRLPKAQDALMSELHAVLGMRQVGPASYTSAAMRARLTAAVGHAVGAGQIAGVLITGVEQYRQG